MTEPNNGENRRARPRKPAKARGLAGWLGRLETHRQRSGLIVGELYALTARAFLKRLEALQDDKAARRFRQRSSSRSVPPTASLPQAADASASPSTLETSS